MEMIFQPASSWSVALFVLLCAGIVVAFLGGVHWSTRRAGEGQVAGWGRVALAGAGVGLWILAMSLVVRSGWIATQPMPRVAIFFGIISLVTLLAALSRVGGWFASAIPIAWLVLFQAFRLPLELILHQWVREGTVPETMTWTGANWDIVTGVVALLAAPFAGRSRAAAWIANIVGIALLINVARVAMMSSPLPFAWPVTPPLQLIFHLPYAWIGPVCIAAALFGHVVLTRALLSPARVSSS